jgi:hypothetical protein
MDQPSQKYWCLGAPETEQRRLDAAELKVLEKELRRQLVGAAAWFLLGPLAPLSLGVACFYIAAAASTSDVLRWVGSGFFVLTFIGLIAGVLAGLDRVRRAFLLRREIRDPRLATFATFLDRVSAQHCAKLLRLPAPPAPGEFRFIVYLASGRVHSVMGVAPKGFVLVTYQTVTAKPETVFDLPRRRLSPAESTELLGQARKLWLVPLRSGLGLGFLGVVACIQFSIGSAHRRHGFMTAILAASAVLWVWTLLRGALRARRLNADAAEGYTVRINIPDSLTGEVLPVSGTLWTIAGEPAPWRTASNVVRR